MVDRKTTLVGVDIGEKFDPLKGVLATLAEKGAEINPRTLSRIRGGFTSGDKTATKLLLGEVLRGESAGLKDQLFLSIAQTGVELRKPQTPYHPERYLSDGFTTAISENLKLRDQDVRSCLRSMRAELVLDSLEKPNSSLRLLFVETAENYLDAYMNPPSTRGADFKKEVYETWDRNSIKDYYQMMYKVRRSRLIGSWTPFEVEVQALFYSQRVESGQPSTLDRMIGDEYSPFSPNPELVDSVRERSATDFNEDALVAHVNALIFGLPTNPFLSAPR